jgi:DNA topoisomerase VI subunit B
VRHRRRIADEEKKRSYIEKYIPHIGDALQTILGRTDAKRNRTVEDLKVILERSRKV